MPITLVLFGQRPNSRIDHLRFVELIIACVVIIGIQIMWLFHHQNPAPYYDWLLPLQASIALLPLVWMASRLGIFRCIHRRARFGNIHHVGSHADRFLEHHE